MIHAKGTGLERAEKFLGVSIADEKELILIVTKTEMKNAIMKSIMDHAGLESKARAVVFSLPVTDTAGLRTAGDPVTIALEKVHLYNLPMCTIIKKPDENAFSCKMRYISGD